MSEKLKVKYWKTKDLIGADYNPRQITEKQFSDLCDSIKRFGFQDPIIVNVNQERHGIIVAGHQRRKAAEHLGLDELPCVEVDLTLEREREFNIRHNKNTGSFDMDALANFFDPEELKEYGFEDYELGVSGFNYNEEDFDEDFKLPDGEKEPFQQITFTLADEQAEQIKEALEIAKKTDGFSELKNAFGNENSNGNSIYLIVSQWAEQKK